MRKSLQIRYLGASQYLIKKNDQYAVRVSAQSDGIYVCLVDLAECCGYDNPTKISQRLQIRKVKIGIHHKNERRLSSKSSPAWCIGLADAVEFVKERALDNQFKKWFVSCTDELRELSVQAPTDLLWPSQSAIHETIQPLRSSRKTAAAQPLYGVNITLSQIDKLIVELLALKDQILTAADIS